MDTYAVSPKEHLETIYATFATAAEALDYAQILCGFEAAERLSIWVVAA